MKCISFLVVGHPVCFAATVVAFLFTTQMAAADGMAALEMLGAPHVGGMAGIAASTLADYLTS